MSSVWIWFCAKARPLPVVWVRLRLRVRLRVRVRLRLRRSLPEAADRRQIGGGRRVRPRRRQVGSQALGASSGRSGPGASSGTAFGCH